jgi:hypothetical protein
MSIADKLLQTKQDIDDVYEAGKEAEYNRFWDAFQQNGERTNYCYAFAGSGWSTENLNPKHTIHLVSNPNYVIECAEGMFYRCGQDELELDKPVSERTLVDMTEVCKKLDFSACDSAPKIFQDSFCKNITCDLSNVTTLANAFNSKMGDIRNVRIKVSAKCNTYTNAFLYYGSWEAEEGVESSLIFLEGSVIAVSRINLSDAMTLSKESIISIINALSPTATSKSITLSTEAVNNAFGIDVDDESTYPEGSEYYNLRYSKSNWTINYN